MKTHLSFSLLLLCLGGTVGGQARAATPAESLRLWLAELERSTPRQPEEFSKPSNARLAKAAEAVELWCLQLTQSPPATNQALLDSVGQLLAAKNQVDQLLDDTLDVRRKFAALPANQSRHDALCAYLQTVSRLTDLSGRLRYLQVDALGAATPRLVSRPADAARLLERLLLERSSVGAGRL